MHNIELTLVGINYLVWNRVIIVENEEDIPLNKLALALSFLPLDKLTFKNYRINNESLPQ